MYAEHKRDYKREKLVSIIRNQCLKNNCGGIKHISTVFRRMDIDYSKQLCFEELAQGVKTFEISINDEELKHLFDILDKDKSGYIDFSEFMHNLRPALTLSRIQVINEAFNKLDVNHDDELRVDDLQVVYSGNVKRHPKYVSGEWTEEETLRNFLDSLDTPGCPDGKVTREEFLNYYAGVSATVDDDCYFDLMMRSCYGLSPRGNS